MTRPIALVTAGLLGCAAADVPPAAPAPAAARVAAPEPAAAPGGGWQPFRPGEGRVVTRRLAPPPLQYALRRPAPVSAPGPAPRLVKVVEQPNQITDTAAWLERNGLTEPAPAVVAGPSGGGVAPPVKRHVLVPSGPAVFSVFDPDRKLVADLDFGDYAAPGDQPSPDQQLTWAEVDAGVLYVSHRHMGYAADSGGLNAYITAVDLKTGELYWRSAPLVCNTRNFIVRGGHILSGYGFTAEPDFLYVLDRATGATQGRVALRSGPEVLIEKDGKLFVRTYDHDYVFELR